MIYPKMIIFDYGHTLLRAGLIHSAAKWLV